MAEKMVAAHKTLGRGFTNEVQIARLQYDVAVDGGLTTDTYVIGTASGKILILDACVHVAAAGASSGSATLQIGLKGGDVDAILTPAQGAVASLTLDATVKDAAGQKLIVPEGGKLEAVVGTAALTAGKVNVILKYVNI